MQVVSDGEMFGHHETEILTRPEVPAAPLNTSLFSATTSVFFPSPRTRASLRASYHGIARVYDALVPYVSSEARKIARYWLDVDNGERVLDVGTGTGLAFFPLAEANSRGWTEGIDLSPAMLDRARQRMTNGSHARYGLRYADARTLPFPEATFDAVFSSYLLDILAPSDIRAALLEMQRVLRPNGRLVLVYLTNPERTVEHLWTRLAYAAPPLAGGARPVTLKKPLHESEFEINAQTTHSQAGLRSAIIRATPIAKRNDGLGL